jgi:hypothetical protein
MATYLAGTGTPVDVVDYADGYMARTLRGVTGVRVRPFSDGVAIAVSRDTLLVMQSILPATMRPELVPDADTRVFFWTLHPMNLVQALVPLDAVRHLQARYSGFHRLFGRTILRGLTAQLRSMVLAMHARRAIAFMDGETLDATSARLEVTIPDPLFLPVPTPVPDDNRCAGRMRSGPFVMAWLGRLSDFKIHILLRTLAQASEYAASIRQPIVFHVIGDGPEARRIVPDRYEHEWFTVVLTGVLVAETLDDYLVSHVDVLAAMGTSALEGAKLGLPTILLDVSYGPVPAAYRFRWLHESDRCTLGRLIDERMLDPGNDSLRRMLDEVRNNPEAQSNLAHRYCLDRHALPVVGARFADVSRGASFRWADINPALRRKGIVRTVYEQLRHVRRSITGAA